MKKYYLATVLFFSLLFSNYLDVQFASFSYTIGGSYGSCVKFKKSEYNFSDFNECSCAWAANTSSYSDCYELFYNPQTKMIKYNLSEGGEYIYRSFSSDYTCHIYNEEIQMLECSGMNEFQCGDEDVCEWINDYEWSNCSSYNSASECSWANANGGNCDWSWNSTQWQDTCSGGSFQLDTSYCQEIQMLECSEMNELECSGDDSCNWTENIETGNCSDITNSSECYQTNQCSWYNAGNYGYLYDNCYGGTYEIDNSYCEEIDYLSGDINNDSIINILDVIETINLILQNNYDVIVDMDNDQQVNILDIIQLINIILNN